MTYGKMSFPRRGKRSCSARCCHVLDVKSDPLGTPSLTPLPEDCLISKLSLAKQRHRSRVGRIRWFLLQKSYVHAANKTNACLTVRPIKKVCILPQLVRVNSCHTYIMILLGWRKQFATQNTRENNSWAGDCFKLSFSLLCECGSAFARKIEAETER